MKEEIKPEKFQLSRKQVARRDRQDISG